MYASERATNFSLHRKNLALRDEILKEYEITLHLDEAPPPLSEMPDTTGEEIPAEALRFATFLKLDKPKKKAHPSRGNIH